MGAKKQVRINMAVEGEPAAWLVEWKRRGLVTSYTDAVIQGFRLLRATVIEQDVQAAQRGTAPP